MSPQRRPKDVAAVLVNGVRKRAVLLVVTLAATFGFVFVGTTSAFGHDNLVVGTPTCTASGTTANWVISWKITNDWYIGETATVDSASVNGVPLSSVSNVIPTSVSIAAPTDFPDVFTTGTVVETLPGSDSGNIGIDVLSNWSDGFGPLHDQGNAVLPGVCEATTTATQSSLTGTGIVGSVTTATDVATVTSSGTVAPTGSVAFYDCFSAITPISTCSAAGTSLGNVTLTSGAHSSTATSPSIGVSQIGYYCFFASYAGGTQNLDGQSNTFLASAETNSVPECFQITGAISPPPSGPNLPSITSTPSSTSFVLGGSNSDTVTVTGVNNVPTGSVTFYECGPGATTCTTSTGTQVGSAPVSLTGSGSDTASATSLSFKPSAAGSYCYVGFYSGDSRNSGGSDTNGPGECFVVTAVTTPSTTVPTTVPTTTPTTTPAGNSPAATSNPTVNVATAAAKATKPAAAVATAAAAAVPGATIVHTGKPWAGSGPFMILLGGLAILMIGSAELLRRRSHR